MIDTQSTSQVEIKSYSDEYLNCVLELYRICFGKVTSENYWKWKYFDSPWGSKISLGFYESFLSSHYGGIFLRVNFKNKTLKVFQPTDSMSNPKMRSGNIFLKTSHHCLNDLSNDGLSFAFGFPGSRHKILGEFKLKYEEMETPKWLIIYPPEECIDYEIPFDKNPKLSFTCPSSVASLWPKFSNQVTFSLVRDESYFMWRYDLRPDKNYFYLEVFSNSTIAALAVLSIEDNRLYLMDYLYDPKFQHIFLYLVQWIVLQNKRWEFSQLHILLPQQQQLFHSLDSVFDHSYAEADFSFIYRNYQEGEFQDKLLRREFHYTLGDYDVF